MAHSRICSADDCSKPQACLGLCDMHYRRMKRYGSLSLPEKTRHVCSIVGCEKPSVCRNLCNSHYGRLKVHGDPLAGAVPKGEALRYLNDVVVGSTATDCIKWPYNLAGPGYGKVYIAGKSHIVSRVVCERAHGPAPTPKHQAAHSCGNGHLGCVTPAHLSWKTPAENCADRTVHGTQQRGAKQWKAKLTENDVRLIRQLKGTMPQHKIGELFGVAQTTVANVHRGGSWSWLE